MKRYFIILIILIILMGVFSMDILGRNIADIQRRMVGQTDYRINVVKGVVATVNINKTFGCYIAGETVIYPNIPTFSRDPKLQVGDKVTIEFINGCRETPVILAPEDIRERPDTTLDIIRYALIVAIPNEIQLFDMNGNLKKQLAVDGWSYAEAGISMDSQGNVYLKEWNLIKKYDSDLNLLITKNLTHSVYGMSVGPNGYLYTMDLDTDWYVRKRNPNNLNVESEYYIGYGGAGMAYYYSEVPNDSDGNFYITALGSDWQTFYKYDSDGNFISELDVPKSNYNWGGFGIVGNYLYYIKATNQVIYIPLDLSAYHTWNLPSAIAYTLTIADGHLILSGWDGDGDGATSKYDSDRNLVWTVKLTAASYAYEAGGYNF